MWLVPTTVVVVQVLAPVSVMTEIVILIIIKTPPTTNAGLPPAAPSVVLTVTDSPADANQTTVVKSPAKLTSIHHTTLLQTTASSARITVLYVMKLVNVDLDLV